MKVSGKRVMILGGCNTRNAQLDVGSYADMCGDIHWITLEPDSLYPPCNIHGVTSKLIGQPIRTNRLILTQNMKNLEKRSFTPVCCFAAPPLPSAPLTPSNHLPKSRYDPGSTGSPKSPAAGTVRERNVGIEKWWREKGGKGARRVLMFSICCILSKF